MIRIALTIILATFCSISVAQAQVKIKKHHFQFSSKDYFRAGSESIVLGSYGEKKTPAFKANYLEVQRDLSPKKFKGKVKKMRSVSIDWSNTSKADWNASVNAEIIGAKGSGSYSHAKKAKVRLVKFEINAGDVKDMVNKDNKLKKDLHSYKKARIAHHIFVVMSHTESDKWDNYTNVSAEGTTNGVKLTGSGGGGNAGTSTFTLSKGTTFAYLLAKCKIKKSTKRVKKQIQCKSKRARKKGKKCYKKVKKTTYSVKGNCSDDQWGMN